MLNDIERTGFHLTCKVYKLNPFLGSKHLQQKPKILLHPILDCATFRTGRGTKGNKMYDSEYTLYYASFPGIVAHEMDPDPDICICRGSGWILSNIDTWHPCWVHKGSHPEDDSADVEPWNFNPPAAPKVEGPEPELVDDIPF